MAPKYILNADKFEQSCTAVSVFLTFEKSVGDGTIPTKTLPEAQRTQGIDSLQLNRMPFALVTNLANVVPLELVQNLTTRWCHQHGFQI